MQPPQPRSSALTWIFGVLLIFSLGLTVLGASESWWLLALGLLVTVSTAAGLFDQVSRRRKAANPS